jgi:cysteine synthase A
MRRCSPAAIAAGAQPDGSPAAPHPSFKPHPMQGWTPDFIPKLTGDAVDMKLIDSILPIAGPDAIRCSKDLAQKEGIFVGITSGATFAGALEVAPGRRKAQTFSACCRTPASAILSTPLFADIAADMNEEELSRSTPGGQLKT